MNWARNDLLPSKTAKCCNQNRCSFRCFFFRSVWMKMKGEHRNAIIMRLFSQTWHFCGSSIRHRRKIEIRRQFSCWTIKIFRAFFQIFNVAMWLCLLLLLLMYIFLCVCVCFVLSWNSCHLADFVVFNCARESKRKAEKCIWNDMNTKFEMKQQKSICSFVCQICLHFHSHFFDLSNCSFEIIVWEMCLF